jgi:DNA-binding NarL/FixJ family response regulator
MIKIHIVDDMNLTASAIGDSLNSSSIVNVTAIHYDLNSCRNELLKEQPDVLLLDIVFSKNNGAGVDFCDEIKKLFPQLKIIMLTVSDSYNDMVNSFKNGALGFVMKNATKDELISAIETVNNGEKYMSEGAAKIWNRAQMMPNEVVVLTKREREVLYDMNDGYTTKEIAEKRKLSEAAIWSRKGPLYKKLVPNPEPGKPITAAQVLRRAKLLKLLPE